MRKQLTALAGLAALAACAVSAAPGPAQADPPGYAASPVWCEIRVDETRYGARYTALAGSRRPIEGQYRFVLIRTGGSGESNNEQSGSFELEPGEVANLGSSEISLDRRARVRALLVLETRRGVVCQDAVRS